MGEPVYDSRMGARVPGVDSPRTAGGKLRSPSLGRQAIDRPRLIEQLDESLDTHGSFLMLSAPAGFGKTYLLSQWAQSLDDRNVVAAWCTVTDDDRDPRVLWNSLTDSLITALRCPNAELADELAALSPSMDPQRHALFLAGLYATLARFGKRIVIIADDTEILEGSASEHEFIQLIKAAPPNVRIVFATRSPLQTQSARISGRLIELTADSLSFSRTEAAELLSIRGLTDADFEQVYLQSEGWPAALSLAVLNIEVDGAPDPVARWNEPGDLYDYLRQEVFDDLTGAERDILLTMGVTPLTTPLLATAMGGDENSAVLLRDLSQNKHLLTREEPDSSGRVWYRVQQLFGSFLADQLNELSPRKISDLIERAVEWHRELGDARTALSLALSPPNSDLVERVLRTRGYELVENGHAIELLELMPPANSEAFRQPFARLMMAYAAASAAQVDRAEEFLAAPHVDGLGVDDLLEWDWLNYLVQLRLALALGRPIFAISSGWHEDSLASVPEPLSHSIRLTRALIDVRTGQTRRASDNLRASLASAENEGNLSMIVMSTVGMAATAVTDCDFRSALGFCERASALASLAGAEDVSAPLAVANVIASWSTKELLELERSRDHASMAVRLADEQDDPQVKLQAKHIYNDVHFDSLTQKRRVAQEFVTDWPALYLKGASPTAVTASLLSGMRMAQVLAEPRWSERLLDRARHSLGEGYDWQVAYCLHLLATGRDEAVRSIIAPLVNGAKETTTRVSTVVASSIDAVLKSRASNDYQAHAAIYRALELADETGAYYEVIRCDVKRVARLLAAGAGRFGPHEHIAKLLLSGETGESILTSGALTTRERQILGELRTLRTVEEISHDLLLSVNTVKTHMRGIYRKLDVTSRRQAVTKAERYGLL